MKTGRLIVAAMVLVTLVAALYWSNHRPQAEGPTRIPANTAPRIISLNQDDIGKLEVKTKDGDDVTLTRVGPDDWKVTSPKSIGADGTVVSAILRDLSLLDADRLIEDKASDMKRYGLAEPVVELSATGQDDKSHKLLIGDDTPSGGDSYAMLEGDPRVFTVPSSVKTDFNKGFKDLRDKHLLTLDFDKVNHVELSGPKLQVAFTSNNGEWVVQNPKNLRADMSKFEEVYEKLRMSTMDPKTPDYALKGYVSKFSSGSPVATVKVTDPSGSQEMQIRKNKDEENKDAYYAKSTALDGVVYRVSSDLGEGLDKDIEYFLQKTLFDFGVDNPDKVEMHDGDKTYLLNRTGDDWWSDGKKLDPTGAEDFLRTIRILTARKFVTTGFTNPAITLTVTSQDGKRIEKVQIAKSGDDYIAKREGGPQLYELDANGIDELRNATSELKPAQQAPAAK